MAKKDKVFRIVATLPKLKACECDNTHEANKTVCRFCWDKGKRYKAPKVSSMLADQIQNVAELHREWSKAKVLKVAKAILNDAKKPLTIEDIKGFIKQSRQDYGCKGASVDDVWETGSTADIAEEARQEGREEVLFELEEYLKRGN